MRATQAISGAARASTATAGGALVGDKPVGDRLRRRADDAGRRVGGRAHRFAQRREPRRDDDAAAGAEDLQVDMIVPRIDRGDDRDRIVGGEMRRRIGGERRHADDRLVGGERNAARRGDADAQAR